MVFRTLLICRQVRVGALTHQSLLTLTAVVTLYLQADMGGSIDPSVFTDTDGKQWLLFKNDGNAVGQPTYIYLCPLTPDALQVPSDNLKQPGATHAVALLDYFNQTSCTVRTGGLNDSYTCLQSCNQESCIRSRSHGKVEDSLMCCDAIRHHAVPKIACGMSHEPDLIQAGG